MNSNPSPTIETDEPLPTTRDASLLPLLRLCRLSNVLTAVADVMMGFFVSRLDHQPLTALIGLAVASAMLYTAGMVLNDWFDIDIDRVERPNRPLPSGAISLDFARALGIGLLLLGCLLGWIVGIAYQHETISMLRSGAVATLLAGMILLYNAWLKHTLFGPIAMGSCRSLNILLGMSLAPAVGDSVVAGYPLLWILLALSIGVYIAGVTWFSRQEAVESSRVQLTIGLAIMFAGLGGFAWAALSLPVQRMPAQMFLLLLACLGASVLLRGVRAIADPSPASVQPTVKQAILSLIMFHAAVVMLVLPPIYAMAIVLMLIPTIILQRYVYST